VCFVVNILRWGWGLTKHNFLVFSWSLCVCFPLCSLWLKGDGVGYHLDIHNQICKINLKKLKLNNNIIKEIKKVYSKFKEEIERRLEEFKSIGKSANPEELFTELAFCILTPQSKAKLCWEAIQEMSKKNILLTGTKKEINKKLQKVRFKNKKTQYLIEARNKFFCDNNSIYINIKKSKNPSELREYFVKNVKGIGWKEASHFLRNIGLGEEIAILDRHIIRNLIKLGVIKEYPKNLSEKNYEEIEGKMKKLSKDVDISMDVLDLVFWAKETGEVFK
jgi:N-glycosylase/DNA lyase